MSTRQATVSLGIVLIVATVAGGGLLTLSATTPTRAASSITSGPQTAPPASGFIAVEGADLNSKMESALKRARAAAATATPFWTAYAFDVRPGVAVDPDVREFHGSLNSSGGTSILTGTSNGMTVETRNLGIFILRDGTANNRIARVEVYNLERRREYSRYPVYWLGRADNEESLNFLRGLVDPPSTPPSTPSYLIAEHATIAIALHDDARVGELLKNLLRGSSNQKVRATSVFWLGQIGGHQGFLSDIVRSEREDETLRAHAAHAIGESRDPTALAALQSLYDTVSNRTVRRAIIHAVSNNENREAATSFLLKVAKSNADGETRQLAVHQLGEMDRESVVDELMTIYAAERNEEVQAAVLHALSEMTNARAQMRLLEIARNREGSAELRAQAIHWIGEHDSEATADELMKIYEADRNEEVRSRILHAFSEMRNQRAEDLLFAIARRSGEDRELRAQAIHWIGERAGQRSLELLRDTANSSSAETEVQMQAVHAISERSAEEAVPLLIKIARTHPNQQVRHQAIHWLGESGDPRAIEFFKELLTK